MRIPEQFDSRFVRIIAGIIAPGALTLIPWLLVADEKYPAVGEWLFRNEVLSSAALLLLVFSIGMVCENIGSHVELHFDKKHKSQDESWTQYLKQRADNLVGHRYISSLVTRLKFELGMFVALPFAALAIAVLGFCQEAMPSEVAAFFVPVAFASAFYFYREAGRTVELLANTRRELTGFAKSPQ